MIFELVEHPNATFLVEREEDYNYTAWELLELLRNAFPNQGFYISCFSGYENAVEIPRN